MSFKDLSSAKKKSADSKDCKGGDCVSPEFLKDCEGGDCVSTEFSKELSPKTSSKDSDCKK